MFLRKNQSHVCCGSGRRSILFHIHVSITISIIRQFPDIFTGRIQVQPRIRYGNVHLGSVRYIRPVQCYCDRAGEIIVIIYVDGFVSIFDCKAIAKVKGLNFISATGSTSNTIGSWRAYEGQGVRGVVKCLWKIIKTIMHDICIPDSGVCLNHNQPILAQRSSYVCIGDVTVLPVWIVYLYLEYLVSAHFGAGDRYHSCLRHRLRQGAGYREGESPRDHYHH